jgi:hypothetical protein
MAISLEKRLKGKEDEVIRTVKSLGWSEAMDLYDVRDPLAFQKYLASPKRKIPIPNMFACNGNGHALLSPNTSYSLAVHDEYIPLIDRVSQRLTDRYSQLKAEIERKDKTIKELRRQLDGYKLSDHEKYARELLRLLEVCEA